MLSDDHPEWRSVRDEDVASFAAEQRFGYSHDVPAFVRNLPFRWLKGSGIRLENAVTGRWQDTAFTEFDYERTTFGDDVAITRSSCAVTSVGALFAETTLRVFSSRRLRRARRAGMRADRPPPLNPSERWLIKARSRPRSSADRLLDDDLRAWLISSNGPVESIEGADTIAFSLTGPWIVCDTPLVAPDEIWRVLDALDGFRSHMPVTFFENYRAGV